MKIEKYLIHPTDERKVPELLDAHFAGPAYREFRVQEIIPVATFAVSYFFDAVQVVFDRAMLSAEEVDIQLPSGWRARKVDIGHHWKRHIEFTSPDDPEKGFVLQGLLGMEETERPEADRQKDWLDKMMSSFKEKDRLVEKNETSEDYLPENSMRIDRLSAYSFGAGQEGIADTRNSLYDSLLKTRYASEAFEYRPQNPYDEEPYELSVGGRSITEPGAAIDILRIVSEFVHAYDMDRFAGYMHAHSNAVYMTLQPELVSLFSAARGAMQHDGAFPASPFPEMVEEIWRRAACSDILRNMDYLTESADALIEMGHMSRSSVFDCNDGRTRAYATTDGETVSLYSEWEEWSTLFEIRADRIAVFKCDFDTGEIGERIIDFCHEDGMATQINEICSYEDLTAGVMRRALVDISSVHCYVVDDRQETPGPSLPSP